MAAKGRGWHYWCVQGPGWLLLVYLVLAQGVTAFDYDLGVAMGAQEPAEVITEVGTASWYGFAFGDLVFYIPLLALGLIGHHRDASWWRVILAAGFGVTVYWPVVCLATIVAARDASGWRLASEVPYWSVLPVIAVWGLWGLVVVSRRERASSIETDRPDRGRAIAG
jgi:hypothetical protein